MRIIVDAFGGDNAPLEIIKGSASAVKDYNIDITLVGNEATIREVCADADIDASQFTIVHADSVIGMNEAGSDIMKSRSDSSMAVGLKLLADGEGDGFVTAGNSGAVCVGATLIVKRIKGVSRPGFAPILPGMKGHFMLLDSGANLQCRPEMLRQFGLMGSIYMEKVMGVENPRVGLANVGVEEHKGTEVHQEAYKLLGSAPLNFVGNIEGRDIPDNACDVLVCDGFTGNLILKTYEGVAMSFLKKIKGIFYKNLKNKIGAALMKKDVMAMKEQFNYNDYGGAPILGVRKPVFKAHGNADADTFKNAIRLTLNYINRDVVGEISNSLAKLKEED
ncbi:MAG: phosphate acyltransferase PlsX [Ruminococcus sp.]|nr:phosphate acyltransferase PlsX [Ruminococcus sp.]